MATDGAHFTCPIEVRFRDVDAFRVVNNAVYFTYLEQARIAFWRKMLGRQGLDGLDFIVARAECDFRRPLTLGDSVEAGIRVGAVGRSSFTLDYELRSPGGEKVFATARTVQVAYDFERSRPRPLPDELRARLEEFSSGASGARESGSL